MLNLLEGNPSGLSQTGLSRQLVMHRSNVTGLVDRLEKRRLVKREDAAGDRRAYRVVLTPKGAGCLGRCCRAIMKGRGGYVEHLSKARAAELIADFRQIARNAERVAAGLPQPEGRQRSEGREMER